MGLLAWEAGRDRTGRDRTGWGATLGRQECVFYCPGFYIDRRVIDVIELLQIRKEANKRQPHHEPKIKINTVQVPTRGREHSPLKSVTAVGY